MKTISQLLLLALTMTTLSACDEMGKGPSRPASEESSEITAK
ncbi:MAG: hypothetical protein ACU841_12490 [Gammaproteobacteria bacterium]